MANHDLPLVTIIIPTYNRFDCLLNALDSAKNQTYENTEIIVVNDRSTQEEYYNYDYSGCTVVHLDKNSKARFGHASPGGYQRNVGMKLGTGVYYAFLDDDDYWMPDKIEKQVAGLLENPGAKMSCTDAYWGKGAFLPMNISKYVLYNKQKYFNTLKSIYKRKQKEHLFPDVDTGGFPKLWTAEFVNTHNCLIASSVMIDASVVKAVGNFTNKLWAPDHEYWKRILNDGGDNITCLYLDEPLLYYDGGHGGGQNY